MFLVTQKHVYGDQDVDDDCSSLASILLDERVREAGDVRSDAGGGVVLVLPALTAGALRYILKRGEQLRSGRDRDMCRTTCSSEVYCVVI